MNSLQSWTVLACTTALLAALLVFLAISKHVEHTYLEPVFNGADELELEEALNHFQTSGKEGLSAYLKHLDKLFAARHYLLNGSGTDVVSGTDHSHYLPQITPSGRASKVRGITEGRFIVAHRSQNGHFWLLAVNPPEDNRWTLLPYYLLIVAITALLYCLCWGGVLRPLERVTATLERFGSGHISVRIGSKRKDEMGRLSRSFDIMADRIESLRESEHRLLLDISHELRSPLTRLQFVVKLWQTNPNRQLVMERVERELARLTALISELTELTRIEGHRKEASNWHLLNLASIVQDVLADCKIEAEERRCYFNFQGEEHCVVEGEETLLRRAIENVLRNAIRYSPDGCSIDLTLTEEGQTIFLIIRDFGPGVAAKDNLELIFDRFTRFGSEPAASRQTGLGLGLSIAKRAIEALNGSIHAENSNPGLRLTLCFPRMPTTLATNLADRS